MKTYEISVQVSLRPDGDKIFLVTRIRLPQFAGKSLVKPTGHIFENNDPSRIKYVFDEDTSGRQPGTADKHIDYEFEVEIGKCIRPSDTADRRTLGTCSTSQTGQPNALLSKYFVIVEITGSDGRKIITSISENADIDLVKKSIPPPEEQSDQA